MFEKEFEKQHILVVDDNEMNRDMLGRRLERKGILVSVAVDGSDALRKLEEESFDLVLLDIMMPDMSGIEVLQKVRETKNLEELPIIMVTAKAQDDDVIDALDKGANDYVTKPINFKVAYARINSLLNLKKITNALNESNQNLENTVNQLQVSVEKIAELNKDLKEKQEQIIMSRNLESVGKLAAGIAHNLNNIFCGISGYASLIKRAAPQEDQKLNSRITNIEGSIEKGSELIAQLLSFARKDKNDKIIVDPNSLVGEVCQLTMSTASDQNVKYETSLASDIFKVQVDPTKTLQALLNVLSNARQAMPDGGIVNISTENIVLDQEGSKKVSRLMPGPYIKIDVRDTGVGIPQENLEKIFEPFFTTRPISEGSGLGLSSAIGAIHDQQGTITVTSLQGEGSTFSIYLPAVAKESQETKTIQQEQKQPKPEELLENKTILAVDDEANILSFYQEAFESHNVNFLKAKNSDEALKLFSEHQNKIDLVILDLVMPGLSGYEVYEKMKAKRPDLKIIIATGFSPKTDLEDAISKGEALLLRKPYTLDALLNTIQKALD